MSFIHDGSQGWENQVKNIELLENKLDASYNVGDISPIFAPDGHSCCIIARDEPIVLNTVSNIINALFQVVHGGNSKPEQVFIVFVGKKFGDKLTYVLLECYLEHIITDHKLLVKIIWENYTNIFTHGMVNSPLQKLCIDSGSDFDKNAYAMSLNKSIGKTHYRRVFHPEEGRDDTQSALFTDLSFIFSGISIPYEQANSISEVAVELVGNALEHTRSDCFLDIDIADEYVRKDNPKGTKYYGANICVVNFSPTLLSSQIEEKICQDESLHYEGEKHRYWRLKKIYDYHSRFFDNSYGKKEFFMLSAFQDKISGRPNEYVTGGTGLPMLIKSLEFQAEVDNCYVISGDRKMKFIKGLLEYDENRWIGMNQECDFYRFRPDPEVFSCSPLFFPGTAYNLNFVIPKES